MGASSGFVLCWLGHAAVLRSLSWMCFTGSEQRAANGRLLLTQQTSCKGAACGLLCRELSRKMQLLIFKLEHAKCLIFGLLCMVVSNNLAVLFQDYSPTQFGRCRCWESGTFFYILSASLLPISSHCLSFSVFLSEDLT